VTDWESILRADGPAVWRTARRLVGNDADADECFQEVFIDALEFSRKRSVQHWRALLTKLATARAIDHLRRRGRRHSREEPIDWENLSQTGALPQEQAETAELSQLLRNALVELPLRQAEVFCLACLDGWSYEQIAEQLAISVNSVGVLIHRAKRKLRDLLASINKVSG
jgi:RNA polymerase sigma factor (sigma-70 family)